MADINLKHYSGLYYKYNVIAINTIFTMLPVTYFNKILRLQFCG